MGTEQALLTMSQDEAASGLLAMVAQAANEAAARDLRTYALQGARDSRAPDPRLRSKIKNELLSVSIRPAGPKPGLIPPQVITVGAYDHPIHVVRSALEATPTGRRRLQLPPEPADARLAAQFADLEVAEEDPASAYCLREPTTNAFLYGPHSLIDFVYVRRRLRRDEVIELTLVPVPEVLTPLAELDGDRPDGALLSLDVDDDYAPTHKGTSTTTERTPLKGKQN